MKPIRITMQAFGSYRKKTEIDFSNLKDGGLFLIHGATGSGKTTLLDAISFALFGESSGHERVGAGLRSQLADHLEPTEVCLEFSKNGEVYRVTRSPQQTIQRSRSVGELAPMARLEKKSISGWSPLVEKSNSVTAAIVEIVGLRPDQFRRVILLPQGKFRDFLVSNSREKEEILESIFSSDIYRVFSERLALERKELEIQIRDFRQNLHGQLETRGFKTTDGMSEDLARLQADVIESDIFYSQSELKLIASSELLRLAQENALFSTEHLRLSNRKNQTELEVLAIVPELDRLELVLKELTSREDEFEQAKTTIGDLRVKYQQIERRQNLVRQIELIVTETKINSARLNEQESAKVESVAALTKNNIEAEEIGRELLALRDDSELKFALASHQQKMSELISLKTVFEKNLAQHSVCLTNVAREQSQRRNLEQALRTLKEQWYHGQAGALAERLEPESPCPVCGSLDHPSPAERGELSSLDLKQEIQKNENGIFEVSGSIEKLSSQIEFLESSFADVADKLNLNSSSLKPLEVLKHLDIVFSSQKNEVQLAETELRDLMALRSKIISQIEILKTASQRLALQHSRYETEINQLKTLEASAQAKVETLMQELKQLEFQELSNGGKGFSETLESIKQKGVEAKAFIDSFQLQKASTLKALQDLRLRESALKAETALISTEIEAANLKIVKNQSELSLSASDFDINSELAQFEHRNLEARDIRDRARDRLGNIKSQIEQLTQATSLVATQTLKLDLFEKKYAMVARLAAVARGERDQNATGIGFSRYVLQNHFDRILERASIHLMQISKGQFKLERSTTSLDARSAAGLDIIVRDQASGLTRTPDYLSGGENFMAALSLALGLTDVVQSDQGGKTIESVFIDEGFGMLDPEALDQAIQVLYRLQEGGRLVGIISHVTELKNQLSLKLAITKNASGSHARWENSHSSLFSGDRELAH
jgi:DNA repair protein SbcC/Rad50